MVCQRETVEPAVKSRRLGRTQLSRVVEIDRTEDIDVLYDQHGTRLVAWHGSWSSPAWNPDGHGEHSVEAKVHTLEQYVDTGSRLSDQLEQIASAAGDSDMVVSPTPSENTVRFYLGRGFQPMAKPLAVLFELEPEDVHMGKVL